MSACVSLLNFRPCLAWSHSAVLLCHHKEPEKKERRGAGLGCQWLFDGGVAQRVLSHSASAGKVDGGTQSVQRSRQ